MKEDNITKYDYYALFYERYCHVENDKLMLNNDLRADQITNFIDKIINNLEKEICKKNN